MIEVINIRKDEEYVFILALRDIYTITVSEPVVLLKSVCQILILDLFINMRPI